MAYKNAYGKGELPPLGGSPHPTPFCPVDFLGYWGDDVQEAKGARAVAKIVGKLTFKELHDLIPVVVADNFGPLQDALAYAQRLHDAAVNEPDIRECQGLIDVVNHRIDAMSGEVDKLQKRIQQIAHLAHANEGF